MKPVIGEDEIKSDGYIKLQYEENSNILIAKNLYNVDEFKDTIYISSSEKIKSFTGNQKSKPAENLSTKSFPHSTSRCGIITGWN